MPRTGSQLTGRHRPERAGWVSLRPLAHVRPEPHSRTNRVPKNRFARLSPRFDALRFASLAKAPALVLLAEHDSVIPKNHAMRLFDAWAGPKQVLTIAGTDHSDVQAHSMSWQAIAAFLQRRFGDAV